MCDAGVDCWCGEREVGSEFIRDGKKYRVKKGVCCRECAFRSEQADGGCSMVGRCFPTDRSDGVGVVAILAH